MQAASRSASYIRFSELIESESAKREMLRSLCVQSTTAQRVWELLETPQTVATLTRRLSASAGSHPDAAEIADCLTRFLRAELIQVSPDS